MRNRWVGDLRLGLWLVCALAGALTLACGEPAPPSDTPEEDTVASEVAGDGTIGVDGATAETEQPDGTDHADVPVDPDATPVDGSDDDATAGDTEPDPDATLDDTGDAVAEDGATDEDVPVVGPDVVEKKLPLPSCAGSCADCKTKCAKQEICGPDKQTYFNDCEAICAFNAFDGLNPAEWAPKPCPACAACSVNEKKEPFCVTLKTGELVTVQYKCEATCLDFKPKADGSPMMTAGACKSACSNPPPAGAGCNFSKYLPVCAKDGKTYAGLCHMQACNMVGCFPVGEKTASAGCTPGTMVKECDGECFDAAKSAGCAAGCDAVCGINKDGKGQSYRSKCVAEKAGATVGSCEKISSTSADVCSATLYKGKGCCADVDYTIVKQICASRTGEGGAADSWVTFRNKAEFDCLTAGDNFWNFQYSGPCVCNCTNLEKPVCGDDGQTYTNKCQAECYNPGGKFSWKDGPC